MITSVFARPWDVQGEESEELMKRAMELQRIVHESGEADAAEELDELIAQAQAQAGLNNPAPEDIKNKQFRWTLEEDRFVLTNYVK